MIDEECDCEVGETREVRLALSSGPGYIDEGVERPGLPATVPEGLNRRPRRRSIVNKIDRRSFNSGQCSRDFRNREDIEPR